MDTVSRRFRVGKQVSSSLLAAAARHRLSVVLTRLTERWKIREDGQNSPRARGGGSSSAFGIDPNAKYMSWLLLMRCEMCMHCEIIITAIALTWLSLR